VFFTTGSFWSCAEKDLQFGLFFGLTFIFFGLTADFIYQDVIIRVLLTEQWRHIIKNFIIFVFYIKVIFLYFTSLLCGE
jgi:hypothetical protein